MKKIIIAVAIILTSGIIATNSSTTTFDKNVTATAD